MTKKTGKAKNEILLEMKGMVKQFPSVKALDNVSFTLKSGTVHALMGENGAGKSTLMKCLFGVFTPDSGEIYLSGQKVIFKSPADALKNGVAMVHQELSQALSLTVKENIWLGRFPKTLGFVVSEKEMERKTRELFDSLGLDIDPNKKMSEMSVSKRQMTEIAKAVSYGAKVLVLDEPTSSLNEKEAEALFKIMDKLKRNGCGIVYISHKMEEILRVSDEVTVMRDGKHIATRAASELDMDTIIKLMVGRELENRFPPAENTVGNSCLKVEGLSSADGSVQNVSFELHTGEILGIAGLDGAGRTELLETVFGLKPRMGGKILLHGREISNKNPRASIKNGFALLTEERRRNGIFGGLSVLDNTVLSSLKDYRPILLDEGKMRDSTEKSVESLRVKTPSIFTKIRSLSGGNQQKVILCRWLLTKPEVLMLDEPTRGIDVGAKYEIYKIIRTLAKDGKAVIAVSSEMPELLGLCDRILVMSGGRHAGTLDKSKATQEEIMRLATKYI